jgi:hypothetical protein
MIPAGIVKVCCVGALLPTTSVQPSADPHAGSSGADRVEAAVKVLTKFSIANNCTIIHGVHTIGMWLPQFSLQTSCSFLLEYANKNGCRRHASTHPGFGSSKQWTQVDWVALVATLHRLAQRTRCPRPTCATFPASLSRQTFERSSTVSAVPTSPTPPITHRIFPAPSRTNIPSCSYYNVQRTYLH